MIGSGSMYTEVLRDHIIKCKKATDKPFAVNIPLVYPDLESHVKAIVELKVPIVFTSAGNPKLLTSTLKKFGIKVVHVVSSSKFAKKSEDAGVDAVVCEGFEAGGHNGREETTSMVLIPAVAQAVKIPVIAAGGFSGGKSMLAAMVLGAEGVQFGTRFVASPEASSHENFKQKVIHSQEGDTVLTLKKITPVRMMRNKFYEQVEIAENAGASTETLQELLGRARSKKGMFEGDMDEGELEIGQVCSLVKSIQPAGEIVREIWTEFEAARVNPIRLN